VAFSNGRQIKKLVVGFRNPVLGDLMNRARENCFPHMDRWWHTGRLSCFGDRTSASLRCALCTTEGMGCLQVSSRSTTLEPGTEPEPVS